MRLISLASPPIKSPRDRLLTNIVSSWFSIVVTAALAFFISPFMVHSLGESRYGIWVLALSLGAYTGFFDLGMKQALTRFVPRYYGTNDHENLNKVISSSHFVYLIIGSLTVLVSLVVGLVMAGIFSIPSNLLGTTRAVFIIVGLHYAASFFFKVPAALGPFHRYDLANGVEIARTLIGGGLIVVLLYMGYGLLAVALLTLAQTLLACTARTVIRARITPRIRYRREYIAKNCIKVMLNYGWISFLIVVATTLIFNTDNIIIGIFESSAAVTYYSIAAMIIGYLRVIAASIGEPLTPVVSHIDSAQTPAEIGTLYTSMVGKVYYVFTALCISILFFGDSFIYLWMGPRFESTVHVLFILIVPAGIYLPQVLANSVLLGIGRHKPLMYILMIEAAGNIVLSLALVQVWGIYGVAWGTAIPQAVIYVVVYPIVFNRIIGGSLSGFYKRASAMMTAAAVFTVPPALLMHAVNHIAGWPGFFLSVIVTAASIATGFWGLILDHEDRSKITARLRR